MFDLEKAIQQWSELVLSADSIKNRNIDELKDHLHCEVELHMQGGLDQVTAFKKAISTIGETNVLANEYQKNKTFINKLCAFEYGTIGQFGQNGDKDMISRTKIQLQQSVLWAAAMIACALILRDTPQSSTVLFYVLIPLSTVSILSLNRGSDQNSISCIRTKIKKIFSR